jgi:LysR family transcriptional regulator, nitrogen assimilation regulatory protein
VPLTRAFRERLPEASLCVREALSTTMAESLASGRLDIALLYNARPSPDVESYPLLAEDLFLIEPAGAGGGIRDVEVGHPSAPAPVRLADVAKRILIMPSRPNALRMLVDAQLAAIGGQARIPLEIDGVASILDLVADGAGSAVLPLNAVKASGHPELFQARPIIDPPLRSQLSLAISAHRPTTLTQRTMLELIRELVGSLVGELEMRATDLAA